MGKNNTRKEWYKERTTNIIISQHGDGLGIERQGIWTKILGKLREREPMRPLLPLLISASK